MTKIKIKRKNIKMKWIKIIFNKTFIAILNNEKNFFINVYIF